MKDHAGRTPLHHAVFMENNSVLMASKLMDFGADVNALDTDKRTPLHHAAEANKSRIIPILIKRGAHTNLKDSIFKKTPLELAPNDHIKELIIAYSQPKFMPSEREILSQGKKNVDYKVNKRGQIVQNVEYNIPESDREVLEKPRPKTMKAKKVVKEQPMTQPAEVNQECPNCSKMKGIGPVHEWDKQQDMFIPFNMRNY